MLGSCPAGGLGERGLHLGSQWGRGRLRGRENGFRGSGHWSGARCPGFEALEQPVKAFVHQARGGEESPPRTAAAAPPHVIPPTVVKTDGQTTWMTNQEKPRSPDVD